jgi:hypothetical protein
MEKFKLLFGQALDFPSLMNYAFIIGYNEALSQASLSYRHTQIFYRWKQAASIRIFKIISSINTGVPIVSRIIVNNVPTNYAGRIFPHT